MRTKLASAAGTVLVIGCALGPDYMRPTLPLPVEWSTREVASQGEGDLTPWWRRFEDRYLERLIVDALESNLEVKSALARIEQARARAGIASAERWPTVALKASSQRIRPSRNDELSREIENLGASLERTTPKHTLSMEFGYEIDLWGRFRRASEAAGAEFQASIEDAQAVRILLIAEVTESYFEIRELEESIGLQSRIVVLEKSRLELLRARYVAGVLAETALLHQQAELVQSEAELLELQRQRSSAELRLSFLVGTYPGKLKFPVGQMRVNVKIPDVPAGLPSSLIENRPDVRAAELRLVAANARIGEAKASLLPRISLTAYGGYESDELKSLIRDKSRIWGYGPTLELPLLEGGRHRARVRAMTAAFDEAQFEYKRVVLRALEEVEQALNTSASHVEQQAVWSRGREVLVQANIRVHARFDDGVVSRLDLLDSEKALIKAELRLVALFRTRLVDAINLSKALGAGW